MEDLKKDINSIFIKFILSLAIGPSLVSAVIFCLCFSPLSRAQECENPLYREFLREDCQELSDENYFLNLDTNELEIRPINQGPLGTCYACAGKVLLEYYLKTKKILPSTQELNLAEVIVRGNDGHLIEGGFACNVIERIRQAGSISSIDSDHTSQTFQTSYDNFCLNKSSNSWSPVAKYVYEAQQLALSHDHLSTEMCHKEGMRIAEENKIDERFIELPSMIEALRKTKIHHPFSKDDISGITSYKNPVTSALAKSLCGGIPKKKLVLPPFNIINTCYQKSVSINNITEDLKRPLQRGGIATILINGHEIVLNGYKKMLCKDGQGKDKVVELINIRNSWGQQCSGFFLAAPFLKGIQDSGCITYLEDCAPGKDCLPHLKSPNKDVILRSIAITDNLMGLRTFLASLSSKEKSELYDWIVARTLQDAANKNSLNVVKYLLKSMVRGRVPKEILEGSNGITPVLEAVRNNAFTMLRLFLDHAYITGPLDPQQKEFFYNIATENLPAVQSYLKKDGGKACLLSLKDGSTPMLFAVASDNPLILSALTDYCDPDSVSSYSALKASPLLFAAEFANPKVLTILLKSPNVDLNYLDEENNTVLLAAVKSGEIQKIQDVLSQLTDQQRNSQLNTANDAGETPLWVASDKEKEEVIKLLIQSGASKIAAQNKRDGDTPLHLAFKNGNLDLARHLLKLPKALEIMIQTKNLDQETPLEIALASNKTHIISTLAQEVLPDPNILISKEGEVEPATLLYWAVDMNNLSLVEKLLEVKNINIDLGMKNGMTPLQLAIARKNKKMITLLSNKSVSGSSSGSGTGDTPK